MYRWNDKQGIAGRKPVWVLSDSPTLAPEKRPGGQMRKRLDGGVHQGGCSGLGLGVLESWVGLKSTNSYVPMCRRLNMSTLQ